MDVDKMLRLAAKEGDDGRCTALVHKGANINKVGGSHRHTALHYAARFGHLRCLDTLLRVSPRQTNLKVCLHFAATTAVSSLTQQAHPQFL